MLKVIVIDELVGEAAGRLAIVLLVGGSETKLSKLGVRFVPVRFYLLNQSLETRARFVIHLESKLKFKVCRFSVTDDMHQIEFIHIWTK